MTDTGSDTRYRAGETALLATITEADLLVGHWRQQFDSSAAAGVPAHVTVLYPFLNIDRIDAGTLDTLRTLIGGHRAFTVRFERCARFPDALYLAPTPDQPFRDLTEALVARWPEAPPYGGQFTDVVPHLTVAHTPQPRIFDDIAAALTRHLPITSRVTSIQLLVNDGTRWKLRTDLRLHG
jgi:hypothetical protein